MSLCFYIDSQFSLYPGNAQINGISVDFTQAETPVNV